MFTGIIEEKGIVERISQAGEAIQMTIGATEVLNDVQLGDSIAVNGVCLTVTSFTPKQFTVDIMPETVRATSLRTIKKSSMVNLERAMAANGRFGGHFVTGHVDGVGTIVRKEAIDNAVYYDIEIGQELLHYIVYKGSVAVDGTSLTVFGVKDRTFTISLIPHTMEETVIGKKAIGDIVNIECDMIGKYIEQFLQRRFEGKSETKASTISEGFLKDNGFM